MPTAWFLNVATRWVAYLCVRRRRVLQQRGTQRIIDALVLSGCVGCVCARLCVGGGRLLCVCVFLALRQATCADNLGSAVFRFVDCVCWQDTGTVLAIKKFKESEDDEIVRKTTLREVKILRMLRQVRAPPRDWALHMCQVAHSQLIGPPRDWGRAGASW